VVSWTSNPRQAGDHEQSRRVARAKRRASGLIVAAAVVFVACRIWGSGDGWIGYVEAAAEAAMVGGLADWFAVTALFRHPLGVPLPHTAIIPTRKDDIGRSLGGFVQEHFLDPYDIGERVRAATPSARVANWALDDDNAARVADQLLAAGVGTLRALSDEELGPDVGRVVLDRLGRLDVASLGARALDAAIAEGRHEPLIDAALVGARRWLGDHRNDLRTRFANESPWWLPQSIDERVFTKFYDGVSSVLDEVIASPNHELRRELVKRTQALAESMRSNDATRERVDSWWQEWLASPDTAAWAGGIWAEARRGLLEQATATDSDYPRRARALVERAAHHVLADADLQERIDTRLVQVAGEIAVRSRLTVGEFIASTVARWDASETSDRIELQIGADLQFIRINGTLVGAFIGVLLHAVGDVLG
jgi:uncharacterized membrane-anchored protein YjiN (DUF445 family)